MKCFTTLLLILIFAVYALAQQQRKEIDSLRYQLLHNKSDTGKIDLLNSLAKLYSEKDNDSSLWYAEQALATARRIKDTKREIAAYLNITYASAIRGNYFNALETAFRSLQQAEKARDTTGIFHATVEICRTYYRMDEDSSLLVYARKLKSLVLSRYFMGKENFKWYQFVYGAWLGFAFEHLHQFDSALYYKRLSYQIALSEYTTAIAAAANNLGSLYLKTGNDALAFSSYRTVLRSKDAATIFVAHAYLGLGKLFVKKEHLDSALYYGRQSLTAYRKMKYAKGELNAASLLAEIFSKKNRIDSAYRYLTVAVALKDSVFTQEKERKVQSLQFNERLRQQQLEQERKEAQQRYKTRLKMYGLLGGLVILLAIAFMLYRNIQHKQKANALLSKKNETIQQTLTELKSTQQQLIQREKMASLGELTAGIAHEIQNPLNFVNNFSAVNKELIQELKKELQEGNLAEANSLASELEANEEKVVYHGRRADSIVKGMLQHARASTGKKEPTNINQLVAEYIRLSYQGIRAKDNAFTAVLETHYDPAIGKVKVIPQDLGRVLLNLLNNAFYSVQQKKKLLNDNYEPLVQVSTRKEGNHILIQVRDNGTGMPPKVADKVFQPFFTTKPTGEGTGLGLSLSYDIITKGHGGSLSVHSTEGEGAEFVVQLPV